MMENDNKKGVTNIRFIKNGKEEEEGMKNLNYAKFRYEAKADGG